MDRARIGAIGWISTAQFFILETVAEQAWTLPHSRRRNYISDLGATTCGVYDGRDVCSPLHAVMNGSFLLTGAAMLLGSALLSAENKWARILSAVAGVGVITVGLVPEDLESPLHAGGAGLYFVGGNLALIVLGVTRGKNKAVAAALMTLGTAGLLGLALLVSKNTTLLGAGGTERLAGYPITAGFTLAGIVAITRLGHWGRAGKVG